MVYSQAIQIVYDVTLFLYVEVTLAFSLNGTFLPFDPRLSVLVQLIAVGGPYTSVYVMPTLTNKDMGKGGKDTCCLECIVCKVHTLLH